MKLTTSVDSFDKLITYRYQDRWQIESVFKWIKQHLKIKQFLGCSENVVRIQLLTALISYLLVVLYKHAEGLKQNVWIAYA